MSYIYVVWLEIFFFEPTTTRLTFSLISILVVDEGRVWNIFFFKANSIRNKTKMISNPTLGYEPLTRSIISAFGVEILLKKVEIPIEKKYDST